MYRRQQLSQVRGNTIQCCLSVCVNSSVCEIITVIVDLCTLNSFLRILYNFGTVIFLFSCLIFIKLVLMFGQIGCLRKLCYLWKTKHIFQRHLKKIFSIQRKVHFWKSLEENIFFVESKYIVLMSLFEVMFLMRSKVCLSSFVETFLL